MQNKLNSQSDKRTAILTTYKCNWNCDYCLVDTHDKHKQSPINFLDLKKKINKLADNSLVTLCGGEPGTLSEPEVKEIFNSLEEKKCEIDILTNGLFIKRYSQYLDRIDTVEYHCVENLEDNIEFPNLDQNKFNYLIIITNNNYAKVDAFLDRYPKIQFRLVCNSKNRESLPRTIGFKVLMKNKHRIAKSSFGLLFSYQCKSKVV